MSTKGSETAFQTGEWMLTVVHRSHGALSVRGRVTCDPRSVFRVNTLVISEVHVHTESFQKVLIDDDIAEDTCTGILSIGAK